MENKRGASLNLKLRQLRNELVWVSSSGDLEHARYLFYKAMMSGADIRQKYPEEKPFDCMGICEQPPQHAFIPLYADVSVRAFHIYDNKYKNNLYKNILKELKIKTV